ncbi:uncharacterized protein FOMMEDRAFT_155460 [Fomitiporia mediterranea MF3/22]|uniref:uncharacterized protein n=1 Tax=Fomitiporia mediterranea (strain MF3/22) TaxID=694068 RepID=UPI0004408A74|nr:uncharacterized protein FOMMEDRAFT_155460 [Fomitiporia mediterranea MF3/22]EJD04332.1 hypothetical protein FOMMEDRAFT_155460 [Fomitiporia mediterranea MF3/22]
MMFALHGILMQHAASFIGHWGEGNSVIQYAISLYAVDVVLKRERQGEINQSRRIVRRCQAYELMSHFQCILLALHRRSKKQAICVHYVVVRVQWDSLASELGVLLFTTNFTELWEAVLQIDEQPIPWRFVFWDVPFSSSPPLCGSCRSPRSAIRSVLLPRRLNGNASRELRGGRLIFEHNNDCMENYVAEAFLNLGDMDAVRDHPAKSIYPRRVGPLIPSLVSCYDYGIFFLLLVVCSTSLGAIVMDIREGGFELRDSVSVRRRKGLLNPIEYAKLSFRYCRDVETNLFARMREQSCSFPVAFSEL